MWRQRAPSFITGADPMTKPIRVIIADDHALVLEGLRSLLHQHDDIRVLATATDGERLLDAMQRFTPDVAVVDVRMPYLGGLACLDRIRQEFPETRVLLITAYDDPDTCLLYTSRCV